MYAYVFMCVCVIMVT